MKRTLSRSRLARLSSFTLVELLVVMGIIAILASILIVAASSAINAAKRVKAATYMNQIQTAVLDYYTEYSVYPIATQTSPSDVYYSTNDVDDWEPLMYALCGNINPSSGAAITGNAVPNTRGVAYLSPRRGDVDGNGVYENPISPVGATNYFNIAMDGDYSGVLGDSGTAEGTLPDFSQSAMPLGAKPTVGVALWVNCNPSPSSTNINFWIHTY